MKNSPAEKEFDLADCRLYAGRKAMVLGATGFIGRWTARALGMAGARLFLPVRDRAGAQKIFDNYEIEGEARQLDLLDLVALRELIERIRPDIIFNLAGYGIDRKEQSEAMAYRINADLPEILSQAAGSETGWTGQTIIHAGTAMEYGAIGGDLFEDSVPRPTTLYGKSKLAGTERFSEDCQKNAVRGLTARLFAVYGPGELPTRLLPTLIEAASAQDPIRLTAGLHRRDFVYVEDVAEGLLRLGLSENDRPGQVVNLATGRLTSIRNFTETVAGVLGISPDRLDFGALPTRPEEMRHEPVSIGRLRRLTGWEPETTIAGGVGKTILFHKKSAKIRSAVNGDL